MVIAQKYGHIIRYATNSDIEIFYKDEPFKESARAMILEKDGELLAIAGITVERDKAVVFSEIKGCLSPKIIIWATKQFVPFLQKTKLPLMAIASKEYPNSKKYLEYIGFYFFAKQGDGDVYLWPTH